LCILTTVTLMFNAILI